MSGLRMDSKRQQTRNTVLYRTPHRYRHWRRVSDVLVAALIILAPPLLVAPLVVVSRDGDRVALDRLLEALQPAKIRARLVQSAVVAHLLDDGECKLAEVAHRGRPVQKTRPVDLFDEAAVVGVKGLHLGQVGAVQWAVARAAAVLKPRVGALDPNHLVRGVPCLASGLKLPALLPKVGHDLRREPGDVHLLCGFLLGEVTVRDATGGTDHVGDLLMLMELGYASSTVPCTIDLSHTRFCSLPFTPNA